MAPNSSQIGPFLEIGLCWRTVPCLRLSLLPRSFCIQWLVKTGVKSSLPSTDDLSIEPSQLHSLTHGWIKPLLWVHHSLTALSDQCIFPKWRGSETTSQLPGHKSQLRVFPGNSTYNKEMIVGRGGHTRRKWSGVDYKWDFRDEKGKTLRLS